jgi:predicted esterase
VITPIPGLGAAEAFLYVPTTYTAAKPAPFAMMFHGAGHDAHEMIDPFAPLAATRGLVLLATSSFAPTWDLSYNGGFSTDVVNLNNALTWAFQRVAVDLNRVGLIGFSDGATYVLALGRLNGDFVRRVVAYAPGYLAPVNPVGKPEFFITHGTQDQILSARNTREVIVPLLRNDGYSVEHREWNGGHGVSDALANESLDWFTR